MSSRRIGIGIGAVGLSDLARVAVEFEYQLRYSDHEDLLKGDPPSRIFWTVRLGRLALRRDGMWDYYLHCSRESSKKTDRRVQQQRFVDVEEAVRVATRVFGKEPEHAGYARETAQMFALPRKSTKKRDEVAS